MNILFYHKDIVFMSINKIHYSAGEVLKYVPEELLSQFAVETKADYRIRILQGGIVFNLLLYLLLNEIRFSQRSAGKTLDASTFKLLFPEKADKLRKVNHSSVSRRLENIPISFFEKSYAAVLEEVRKLYTPLELSKYHIVAVDSTLVAQMFNPLENGFYVGPDKTDRQASRRKYVKYTAAFDGLSVLGIDFYDDREHQNENNALPETIRNAAKSDRLHRNLYVIDRGLTSSDELSGLSKKPNRISFLVRISDKRRTDTVKDIPVDEESRILQDKTRITIQKNDVVRIYSSGKSKPYPTFYRHVKALVEKPVINTDGEIVDYEKHIVNLLSDVMELEAYQMLEMYRQRWVIEVFFKFLKQNLNFSRLLSTKPNGLKVTMYMTMIAAMLILIYARKNKIGFRMAKEEMKQEMANMIIAIGILQNGGNPVNFMTQYQVTLPDYLKEKLKRVMESPESHHEVNSDITIG